MSPLVLNAPAKLNLTLRVLHKREDGFHEIDTLMVKLPGLADRLTFTPADGFAFECDDSSLPADESNLVVKAARAFEAATGIRAAVRISLEKKIPHGAGLGGGSSDAAATLSGLNLLHGEPLSGARLIEIAASLGSDIPFFLLPGAGRCTGRGEILENVPAPEPLPVLVLKPWFMVATPDAYRRWEGSAEIPGIRYSPQDFSWGSLRNDLERPVFGKHRFLAELKQWLLERVETTGALLSGSGSSMFAILREPSDAAPLAAAARFELDPHLWSWSGFTG